MTPDPRDLRERCVGLASKKSRKKSSEKGSKLIKGLELTIASVDILTTAGETFCTALTTGVIRGLSARDCRGKKKHRRKAEKYSKNRCCLRLYHLNVSTD
jgi:L-serine deaminase